VKILLLPRNKVTKYVILYYGDKMIYCSRIEDYVFQEEKCIGCIFYDKETDSCDYEELHSGLKQNTSIEEIGHA
jgi:hypothetical protein